MLFDGIRHLAPPWQSGRPRNASAGDDPQRLGEIAISQTLREILEFTW
jgi:hypothetical protein